MITAPIFASRIIPGRVRGALIMAMAAMTFPLVRPQTPLDITWGGVIAGSVGEMMIGLAIGISLAMFVSGVEVAGLMVGRQAGLAIGQVFDPSSNTQVSIIGQVYTISLMTLFLLAGGHRATMAALLDTYEVIPLLSFQMNDSIPLLLITMVTASFVLGIRLAGPVLIALFLTGTAMGFLSRTMPQLNILSVGFTVRVLVALGIAGFALAGCQDVLVDAVWRAFETIRLGMGLDSYPRGLVN
ncbi:MAG: flagellar biosynthetic protein FliR [Planctomycetes bacterium]|nr:flagellar biosynthetic protein FliR [Planctomycetota bacterium]